MSLDPAKRPSPTRYEDLGHEIVKRTKERHRAHHSETLGGQPTVADPESREPAGKKPGRTTLHHSTER